MTATQTATPTGPVLDQLGSELVNTKARLAEVNAEQRDLTRTKLELSERMIAAMRAVGTDGAKNNGHTFNINEAIVPTIVDWDEFLAWLIPQLTDHPEFMSLFERRISAPVYREFMESRGGEEIPGLSPFNKVTLNMRTL